jgi:hypothetical protein
VLDNLDRPREVKSIVLRLGTQGYTYGLPPHSGFKLTMDSWGATSVIFGTKREWSDVVRPQIRTALRDQRPWYFWFRTWWATTLLSNFPFTIPIALWSLTYVNRPHPDWITAVSLYVLSISVGLIVALAAWPRLIPMFEVAPVGTSTRGKVVVAFLLSVAAFVAANIVLPLVLR